MAPRDSKAEVRQLLHELCVDLGFCLPPQEQRRLEQAPPADADSFTYAVYEAEGMDPGVHDQLRRQVRERIDRHMRRWDALEGADRPDDEPGGHHGRHLADGDGTAG
ncbi:hypothetical protein AB0D65_16685 [Streptomyces griseoloalbus]|uniref:Uncharacterized protein n=1 Tax=Streptomyces griseoloalbus TaxID=67303 RepID=A0ABV3E5Z1_9ACTN